MTITSSTGSVNGAADTRTDRQVDVRTPAGETYDFEFTATDEHSALYTGGTPAAASDEHQHVGDEQARTVELAYVERREAT